MNKCLEIFNKIINIPFEKLGSIGNYISYSSIKCQEIRSINYHGLSIVMSITDNVLKIELYLNDQDCRATLSSPIDSDIIEKFNKYVLDRQDYSKNTALEYFNTCIDKFSDDIE